MIKNALHDASSLVHHTTAPKVLLCLCCHCSIVWTFCMVSLVTPSSYSPYLLLFPIWCPTRLGIVNQRQSVFWIGCSMLPMLVGCVYHFALSVTCFPSQYLRTSATNFLSFFRPHTAFVLLSSSLCGLLTLFPDCVGATLKAIVRFTSVF